MKKFYKSPSIKFLEIVLEEGIASGSASLKPNNASGQVMEQWNESDSQSKEFDWNEL